MKSPTAIDTLMLHERQNSFNLLRLLAAAWVFASHEKLMTGNGIAIPGVLGVYVFFIISGFLIARSWEQRGSSLQYFSHRALRILPALWAVVLITTFIIGPIATRLPLARYFTDAGTWRYLLNLVFDHQLVLPGVFHDNPSPMVNIPLWTLLHEAIFYASMALLGVLFGQHLRYVVLCLYLIVLAQNDASLLKGLDSTAMPSDLLIYFLGGAVIWFFRDHIMMSKGLLALAAAALVLQVTLKLDSLLWSLSLPYIVLWLGLRKPAAAFGHLVRNDYSYGLYVWGMVCQQCVVALGTRDVWPHAVLAATAAATCAALSWHLLERRALRLKARSAGAQAGSPLTLSYSDRLG
ncbi:MAG: acyltransferase [Nevskia sp.]|nr:acyltransferase [Nevskia sp.]